MVKLICAFGILFASQLVAAASTVISNSNLAIPAKVAAPIQNQSTLLTTATGEKPKLPETISSASTVNIKAPEKITDLLAPWALGLSILSILVSLGNLFYGISKDRRSRRASINDDFWFRKVVAPSTIEPLLEGFLNLLDKFPEETATDDELATYAREITYKFTTFETSVTLLSLLDDSLPKQVSEKLTECEDWLTSQVGKKSGKQIKTSLSGRAAVQTEAKKMLVNALMLIRTKHLDVHK